MLIFTDPKTNHQVMAIYTHGTTSTVWAGLGYERHEIDENADINRLGRDCYVMLAADGTIADVIARMNSVQPTS